MSCMEYILNYLLFFIVASAKAVIGIQSGVEELANHHATSILGLATRVYQDIKTKENYPATVTEVFTVNFAQDTESCYKVSVSLASILGSMVKFIYLI